MNRFLTMGMAGALAASLSLVAFANGGVDNEVSTAHAHALMAQSAKNIAMAHAHLQHAVNCLVDPNGAGFDAKAENPCKGQGNGAIPDSMSNQALHGKLESALTTAQAGLKSDSLASVQQDAGQVAATLQNSGSKANPAAGGSSW